MSAEKKECERRRDFGNKLLSGVCTQPAFDDDHIGGACDDHFLNYDDGVDIIIGPVSN